MTAPIEMTKDELQTIDDEGLCRRCVEPAIARVRGKPMDVRLRVYQTLSAGQRALLGFWVLYAHGSDGWTGVRAQLPHLVGYEGAFGARPESSCHRSAWRASKSQRASNAPTVPVASTRARCRPPCDATRVGSCSWWM